VARPKAQLNRILEPLFAVIICVSVVYALWHLFTYAYLPQPFFYDPFDLWADWFNTAYWAYDHGTYDKWATLYPPLSFVFLRIFTLDRCYELSGGDFSAGLPARDCDWLAISTIFVLYFLCVVVTARIYWKTDRRTAVCRSIAVGLGWPLLDALERGNLMLASFLCFALAYGPLIKSARLRWLFAGLAVNFKVYLISSIFPMLLKRRWLWFEGALLAVLFVYLASFAMLGRGTPIEIYENIRDWSSNETAQVLDLTISTTYLPLLSLIKTGNFPMILLMGSRVTEALEVVIPASLHVVQLAIFVAAAAAWLRPGAIPTIRLVNLAVMMALISADSGGYTPAYYIFLVFLERWESGFGVKWAVIVSYVLSVSADIPLDQTPPVVRDTYLWGASQIVTYYVMVGPFIRPLLILSIPFALSLTTIRQVWTEVGREGLLDRWRFHSSAARAV
jgi:hypothetical protein